MIRNGAFHESLIPLLVGAVGAESYLEFGTHFNETIGNVKCARRYGVDIETTDCEGAEMFNMSAGDFIRTEAARLAPFDFVFIDADHKAGEVCKDFFGILPHVARDGLIVLHDTNPETVLDTAEALCGDSWVFAKFLHDGGYESVTLPYHPGLTIVRNRVQWGPA